jgi:hypothetical protein
MKKIYSLFLIALTSLMLAQAPTTCSIDPTFNKAGIWPDSATNFVQGTVGQPYGQNITVKISKDTIVFGGVAKFCFNRFELSNPSGYTNFNLPSGISFLAGPTLTNSGGIYKIPAQAASCAVLSGTPTMAGTYTVQFLVKAIGTPVLITTNCTTPPSYSGGSPVSTSTLSYYIIKINPASATGIKEEVNSKTLNLSASPNPVSQKTTIKFMVKDEAKAKITVYNILGDKIFEDNFKTVYGENNYELDASNYNSGIYFYTLTYKNNNQTKRIIVSNNH